MGGIKDFRTTKASINHGVSGKIAGQSRPFPNRGGANEQDRGFRRWIGSVRGFKSRNLLFPLREIVFRRRGQKWLAYRRNKSDETDEAPVVHTQTMPSRSRVGNLRSEVTFEFYGQPPMTLLCSCPIIREFRGLWHDSSLTLGHQARGEFSSGQDSISSDGAPPLIFKLTTLQYPLPTARSSSVMALFPSRISVRRTARLLIAPPSPKPPCKSARRFI